MLKKNFQSGFTLIELMVVVAIIGILLLIGMPQYGKIQAKARQTEVKIQLVAVHTVETSFALENNSYSGCLAQIGYGRDGAKLYYTIGFPPSVYSQTNGCGPDGNHPCSYYQWTFAAAPAGNTTGGAGTYTDASAQCNASDMVFLANIGENIGSASGQKPLPAQENLPGPAGASGSPSITGNPPAFTAGAAGRIYGKSVDYDKWTIDQGKQLINVNSGLN